MLLLVFQSPSNVLTVQSLCGSRDHARKCPIAWDRNTCDEIKHFDHVFLLDDPIINTNTDVTLTYMCPAFRVELFRRLDDNTEVLEHAILSVRCYHQRRMYDWLASDSESGNLFL